MVESDVGMGAFFFLLALCPDGYHKNDIMTLIGFRTGTGLPAVFGPQVTRVRVRCRVPAPTRNHQENPISVIRNNSG